MKIKLNLGLSDLVDYNLNYIDFTMTLEQAIENNKVANFPVENLTKFIKLN